MLAKSLLPDQLGWLSRLIDANLERAEPAAITVVIVNQRQALFLAKKDAAGAEAGSHEALLELHPLNRLAVEWGREEEQVVAVGDLLLRISSIERLRPSQRSRSRRHPLIVTRAGQHSLDGHLLGGGQRSEFVFQLAVTIPY